MFGKVSSVLEERFIRTDAIARAIRLALMSQKNLLLWGPGGHGKSEMVEAALASVVGDFDSEVHVQSFGEGMDEATLWGGLDFAALETEKVLRYYPEQSFLNKEHAVFEELFDAPSSVLLALKDTLTAKKLRKGSQVFAMKTKVIIALTNKDPAEISDLGPAAHALVERFPLQLEVKWDSYESSDYLELIHKVEPRLPGAKLNGLGGVLSELLAKAGESGDRPISPRSAVHAIGVVKAAAALRESSHVEKQDLTDLRFVDGLEGIAESIQEELDAAVKRAEAEQRMVAAERRFKKLVSEFEAAFGKPIPLLQASKRFTAFQDEVAALTVTDGLTERRKALRDATSEKAAAAQAAALESTRV